MLIFKPVYIEMNFINKYIDWIVVSAVTYITTFAVLRGIIGLFMPGLTTLTYVLHILIAFSLILYQLNHHKARIINKGFFVFFLIYILYVISYLTINRKLPLEEMEEVPRNFRGFMFYYFPLVCYFFSAETIIEKFDIKKFTILSFFLCTIPSIGYITFVGVDTLQIYGVAREEETLSWLTISYSNLPLMIMAFFYYDKLFKGKMVSLCFSIILFAASLYILLMATRRGPILFAVVIFLICLQYKYKISFTIFTITLLLAVLLLMNLDSIIDLISKVAPQTADRLDKTLNEGYTNGRFEDAGAGTYNVGITEFEKSQVFGSYFRITSTSLRGSYPHNLFIEILMTMGWLGFIPFIFFILKAFRNVFVIAKSSASTKYLASVILFLSSFFMLQTSGTIVVSISFWLFFYIMCTPTQYFRNQINHIVKRRLSHGQNSI